jgi:hypothetical protein
LNDGSESVIVPSTPGTTNRIKVESVGNIFFDISNTNFTIGAPAACASATGLATSAITETSAHISWTAVTGALSYAVDYKAASSGTWISLASATTSVSVDLSGLTSGTVYDWRVRVTCSAGTGDNSQAQFTTTAPPPPACPGVYDGSSNGSTAGALAIPFNTDVYGQINVRGDIDHYKFTISTGGTVTLSLTNLPADYQLALLNSSGTVVQSSVNTGTIDESFTATVNPGTYYARVSPKNNGALSTSCYTLKVATGTASRAAGEEVPYVSNKLSVSPNPAGYVVNLAFNAEVQGNATVSVFDQAGAIVSKKIFAVSKGANSHKLDVGHLAKGMYFIRVEAGALSQMSKIVVAK